MNLQFCEARRLGLVRPQDPSWCPVTSSFGTHTLLAVSGSSRGWPACCRQVTPGKLGCGLPLRGAHGSGAVCSRLSPSVPGPHESRVAPAVHLRGPARSAASPTQPVGESGKVLAELAAPKWTWGEDTHSRTQFAASLDTLGQCGAPAACTVVEPSGRAGPP